MANLRLRPLLMVMGGAICTSFVGAVGLSSFAEHKLKVGGQTYDDIVRGKDLIADVLPPPAYLIESFLEASQIALDPASAGERAQRLKELKGQYEERREHWRADERLPDNIRSLVTGRSDTAAREFWSAVETRLTPAARSGDAAAIADAYADVEAAYKTHRAAVDEIVEKTTANNARIEEEASSLGATLETLSMTATGAAFLLTLACLWMLSRRLVTPVVDTTEVMKKLSTGQLDTRIDNAERTDEIGDMARAIKVFRDNLAERAKLARESEATSAKERARQEKLEVLIGKFRTDITSFVSVATEEVRGNKATASMLNQTAQASSTRAASAADASARASADVQNVAAATEELAASIRQLLENAERTRTEARRSREVSDRGEAEMSALSQQAQKISAVVEMIQSIASQTNLLALNATIEAARAGEAGRGFAVVAAEVKGLAEQTAKSTTEIEQIVSSMQASVNGAGDSFRHSLSTLAQIESLVSEMASSVTQQNQATGEISSAITRTSDRAGSTAADISELASAAQLTSRTMGEVMQTSDRIESATRTMSLAIEAFLRQVSEDLEDRRAAARRQTSEAVLVRSQGTRHQATLQDISQTGVRAHVGENAVSVGETVQIEWSDGRTEPSRVVWVRGAECGLAFAAAVRAAA